MKLKMTKVKMTTHELDLTTTNNLQDRIFVPHQTNQAKDKMQCVWGLLLKVSDRANHRCFMPVPGVFMAKVNGIKVSDLLNSTKNFHNSKFLFMNVCTQLVLLLSYRYYEKYNLIMGIFTICPVTTDQSPPYTKDPIISEERGGGCGYQDITSLR